MIENLDKNTNAVIMGSTPSNGYVLRQFIRKANGIQVSGGNSCKYDGTSSTNNAYSILSKVYGIK